MDVENKKKRIDSDEWEIIFSEERIKNRVRELGQEISEDYQGKRLLVVAVLRGAFIFTADLVRDLSVYFPDLEVDFIAVSSYSGGEESSRAPRIEKDLNTDIEGWDVLLVEDIVDSGYSFEKLLKLLKSRHPKSLKTCALLSKPDRREVEVPIDFLGFTIPDVWVQGYGLDTLQKGRGRKDIMIKKNSA